MSEDKKNISPDEVKELPIENLDEVAGGIVVDVIPKSPKKNIDAKTIAKKILNLNNESLIELCLFFFLSIYV